MARKLMPGSRVRGYTIREFINSGMMALSYAATKPSGEKVFFKQYKSPSITVPWYHEYVTYQQEIKKRIESGGARNMTVRFIDMFEAEAGPMTYFQVFEFVEGGKNLNTILQEIREKPTLHKWEQRVIWAKVIMGSINALHKAGVVHCDLKPDNIQLFEDKSITAGYRLKLIDMDFSIQTDVQSPWHGHQGYIGTSGYLSPEHLTPGCVPTPASDVFTCGLMLYELLSHEGHPYRFEEDADYHKAVKTFKAKPLRLAGTMKDGARDEDVVNIIHKCLSPDTGARPHAQEVLEALNGSSRTATTTALRPTTPKPAIAPKPEITSDKPILPSSRLELHPAKGNPITIGIRTEIGKRLCNGFGDDSKFMDEVQFAVERGADNTWRIVPNKAAKNETILNGKAIKDTHAIKNGDMIGVGRETKGIVKLPLTVVIK